MKKILTLTAILGVFSGCQQMADRYIDDYMSRKNIENTEKALDEIIKKRTQAQRGEEPSLEDQWKKPYEVSIAGAPVKGPATAAITIVEFSEFECPFCKRVLPTVDEVLKTYQGKVRFAFKHNPLPFHDNAKPAAKAAIAADRQGKFWEMHDKLFANNRELNEKNFKKFATELKLDLKKFEADMKDPAVEKIIEADSTFARSNNAGGTPSFFIGKANGDIVKSVLLVGAQPIEKFKEAIDFVLAQP